MNLPEYIITHRNDGIRIVTAHYMDADITIGTISPPSLSVLIDGSIASCILWRYGVMNEGPWHLSSLEQAYDHLFDCVLWR